MANKLGFSTGKGFIEAYKDGNGVLKYGDTIISQKKLLWSGTATVNPSTTSTYKDITLSETVDGNTRLEFIYSVGDNIQRSVATLYGAGSQTIIDDLYYGVGPTLTVYFIDLWIRNSNIFRFTPRGFFKIASGTVDGTTSNGDKVTVYAIYKIIE